LIVRITQCLVAVACGLLAAGTAAAAAAGDADPLFGGAGYVRYAAPKSVPALFTAAIGFADGSVVVGGSADTEVFVRRYRADGTLDTSFGERGTTRVPGFVSESRRTPALKLFNAPGGGILVEQRGLVRRLTASGALDPTYAPARMNIDGRTGVYNFLPQPDGRFVVVTGQQSSMPTFAISVRFFLPDGTPDTVRGDAHGERVLYPGGEGAYADSAISAAVGSDGKIAIGARWVLDSRATSLVLIRLNADGSYDAGFGQNGVVVIGPNLGAVSSPKVSVGSDGRIGFMFGAPTDAGSDAYFVVYVFQPNGQQDASAPSGGRISVFIPQAYFLSSEPTWLSGSPDLVAAASAVGRADNAGRVMLWRASLSTGAVGAPEFTGSGTEPGFAPIGAVLAGDALWVTGTEDSYIYGRVGAAPLVGFGRGVLLAYDTHALTSAAPVRIVDTFASRHRESFSGAKLLSDGGILVLGTFDAERQQSAGRALTRFTAEGWIDPAYGGGSARALFASTDPLSTFALADVLVPAQDDDATVLSTANICGFTSCVFRAYLSRVTATGTSDATFGNGTVVDVGGNLPFGTVVAPGFVDADHAVTLVRLAPAGAIAPLRFTAAGAADAGYSGSAQMLPINQDAQRKVSLDRRNDGGVQAIVVEAGQRRLTLHVARWTAAGAVAGGSPNAPLIIDAVNDFSVPGALATLPLADGRTLVAIGERSQRIVLRLGADGALDPSFGVAGIARIDGLLNDDDSRVVKLALDANGRVLLAYSTALGAGYALTVGRFTADGQRDTTFTADQRFDSVFSLSGDERASDVLALPDGGILAVGRSGNYGLLLRLVGDAIPAPGASAPVVEFYNTILDHYFTTAGPGEIVSVDTGGAGPGWQRTGYGFRAHLPEHGIPPGTLPVCRFYGTPGTGPNSHFYTIAPAECALVKSDPGWTYEGIAFHARAPSGAGCATGERPVLRAYNNRFAQNDSNHRYLTDAAEYARMLGLGWVGEGLVFCGSPP